MTAANILVVDDEADIRLLIDEILSDEGYNVVTAADGSEARHRMKASEPDLVLLDIWMPDVDGISLLNEWSKAGRLECPVVMMSGHGTVETAVEATRLGATDFVEKPLSLQKLLRTVENALDGERRTPPRRRTGHLLQELPGASARMVELRRMARELAGHPGPVLITGETGSGREAVARYIHAAGGAQQQPFVKLSSAALTPDNAARQLSGADTADGIEHGLLKQAAGGTLFIADLQDLAPEAQNLLLGVLDQGSYTRVGHAAAEPLECRFVASIRRCARRDPAAAGLRDDLLQKLGVFELAVPSLRERAEDIPDLLRRLVDELVEAEGLRYRRFGVAVQNRLRNYPWPGNLDELQRLTRQLLLHGDGPEQVGLDELEAILETWTTAGEQPLVKQDLLALPLREAREQFERAYLTEQLKLCDGKVGRLAKRVGMERTHLYRKLRALDIDFRQTAD
ncbi:MAG TPA: sigma-54-dependent Fis family transcriptional regulator [Chromatiales bacterium]|nr:sigma-54-dependent Fis family transcriptional regulator [Chromatiales bacterium]